MTQSIAIAVVLFAGLGLLLSSVAFVRRYNARQQALVSGSLSRHQQPSYQVYSLGGRLEAGLPPPRPIRTSTRGGPVSRLPEERDAETGDELPTYGVASKAPAVDVLAYPPAAYAPGSLPPPYEREGEGTSAPRRSSGS